VVEGGIINRIEGQGEGMPDFKSLKFVESVSYVRSTEICIYYIYIFIHTILCYIEANTL
jgi:hypothetical protein